MNQPVTRYKELEKKSWSQVKYPYDIYHKQGGASGNEKWVSPDGHHEAVFDENKNFVTDPANMGTYNYSVRGPGHFIDDMVPYWIFGNTPDDPTPFWNRVFGP